MNPKLLITMLNAALVKLSKSGDSVRVPKNQLPEGFWFCGVVRVQHPKESTQFIQVEAINRTDTIELKTTVVDITSEYDQITKV